MIRPPHFIWSGVTVDVAVLWGSALDCHNTSQTLAELYQTQTLACNSRQIFRTILYRSPFCTGGVAILLLLSDWTNNDQFISVVY